MPKITVNLDNYSQTLKSGVLDITIHKEVSTMFIHIEPFF